MGLSFGVGGVGFPQPDRTKMAAKRTTLLNALMITKNRSFIIWLLSLGPCLVRTWYFKCRSWQGKSQHQFPYNPSMLLGTKEDPCVVWAWGPDSGGIWQQAEITGKPDKRWQWITLNKGSEEGFRKGLFLEIFRGPRRVARAEVDKVAERYSVAWILDGTMNKEDHPRLGDEVRILA